MATTAERQRWKEQILHDYPFMSQLPSAIDHLIDFYASDRKAFNALAQKAKRQTEKEQAEGIQLKPKRLPDTIHYGVRKGEPEDYPVHDDVARIDQSVLPAESIVSGETEPALDPEQPAQNTAP